MHPSELVELAALVADHFPAFLLGSRELPDHGVRDYWVYAKCRSDRWQRALRAYTDALDAQLLPDRESWLAIRPILEEILASEILSRVWAAAASGHAQRHRTRELDPVARSILQSHQESRHRALNLMVYGRGFNMVESVALNHLRRRCERWTDLLLGRMMQGADVTEFAFDAARTRDFAEDLQDARDEGEGRAHSDVGWQLAFASLKAAFQNGMMPARPNADLNRRIGAAVISCFGSELFDADGLLKSVWLLRLESTASDTQGLIDELFRLDAAPVNFRNG